MSSQLMRVQDVGAELVAGMRVSALGQIPEAMVEVVDGVQRLTAAGNAEVARLLRSLVLTPLLGAIPPNTIGARAVTCAVAQSQNVGCFPTALQYIRAAQQQDPTPPLISVVDFRAASADEVIILTTRDMSIAMSLSPPGSQNAIFDYNVQEAPPPGGIATTTKKGGGALLIGGAVAGALLGAAVGGPPGAVAGGLGGAVLGGIAASRA